MRRGLTVAGLALLLIGVAWASSASFAASRGSNLPCANKGGTRYVLKFRPGTCVHFGWHGSFAGGVYLVRLRWRGWGRGTAHAKGIEQGFHLPFEHVHVSVTAFRLRRCGRTRTYTRLRSTSHFGTTFVRMSPCPGRAL